MTTSLRRLALLVSTALALASAAAPAGAATFTVTSTADAGAGSLRQAITGANASAGYDTIAFAIPGDGPHVITPLAALPALTERTFVNGTSQPGTSCDAWPPTLHVVLDGSQAGDADGLTIQGGDSSLFQGLVIHSFAQAGIHVLDAADVVIRCNFVGTDATGSADAGNGEDGVRLDAAPNALIGSQTGAEGNLISGNGQFGVVIYSGSEDSEVVGNRIGTDVSGMAALPNGNIGVYVRSADVTVGGPGPLAGNLVSANFGHGVAIGASAQGALVFSNRIGVDALGDPVLGNDGAGVLVTNDATGALIGAPPFEDQPLGNVIAGNGGHGVSIYLAGNVGNSIRANEIFENGSLGIGLLSYEAEPTPNDPGDADEGPNRFQNFPVIGSAQVTEGIFPLTFIYAVPTDPANATYPLDIDFYLADADGEEGRIQVAYDGYGLAEAGAVRQVSLPMAALVQPGDRIVATATDAAGNTSEFSVSIRVPEPAAGAPAAAALALAATRAARRRARDRASRARPRG